MNFDFSDDQKFLGNEARKFLDGECTTQHVREVLNDDDKSHHEGVWTKVKKLELLTVEEHIIFHLLPIHIFSVPYTFDTFGISNILIDYSILLLIIISQILDENQEKKGAKY